MTAASTAAPALRHFAHAPGGIQDFIEQRFAIVEAGGAFVGTAGGCANACQVPSRLRQGHAPKRLGGHFVAEAKKTITRAENALAFIRTELYVAA